jgi:hypothetical protein
MATFTRTQLLAEARPFALAKSARSRLHESFEEFSASRGYDVFLSHSSLDAEVILGLKVVLERHGLSVYVDWIDDANLDRVSVTPETASILRGRMRSCRALFYALSANAASSKWMPWELGYFDGLNGRVAIVPVTESAKNNFLGQEYLGLYPFVDEANNSGKVLNLWVNPRETAAVTVRAWLRA